MPVSRFLITAALYIFKMKAVQTGNTFSRTRCWFKKLECTCSCMNAVTLDYSEGPNKRSSHCVRAGGSVVCHQRARQFARFERGVRHPARNRRLCLERREGGGTPGNCVTGLGIKCAWLNDKSSRCVCARVFLPHVMWENKGEEDRSNKAGSMVAISCVK